MEDKSVNEKDMIMELKTEKYQVKLMPFGLTFREQAPSIDGNLLGTTASVSVTAGPDTDTDPPD
ncbi:hypothetical protein ACPCHR_24500 [Bacillus bombysepticus]